MVRSATLGKLFNTTKYGSATFDKKLDHHKIIAIAIPKVVPTKNPTTVSYTVTPICFNKSFEVKFIKVANILLGWLVIKLSIIPLSAKISHISKKDTSINICVNKIKYFLFLFFLNILFYLLKLLFYSSTPNSFHRVLKY